MPSTARSETVGSLLRPPYLMEARQERRDGKIDAEALRAVEDRAVLEAIALQKAAGLDVITDAEYRRLGWNPATNNQPDAPFIGYSAVDDYRITYMKFWRDNTGTIANRTLGPASVITSPLKVRWDIATSEYGFLSKNAGYRTKYPFTAPSSHRHFWTEKHSKGAYPTVDAYLTAV